MFLSSVIIWLIATVTFLKGQVIDDGYSEVFEVVTMGGFTPSLVTSPLNCPHLAVDLTQLQTTGSMMDQDLVIVSGEKLLVTANSWSSSDILRRITVQNGATLVFNDEAMNVHVREIVVEENAVLSIGSESCRLASSISITFHGSNATSSSTDDITGTPSKGLISRGTVDIHGKLYHPTWTRLATTAAKGETSIRLQQHVNWEVGQEILLTPTVFYDCSDEWKDGFCGGNSHQNEVRTITSVSMDDSTSVYEIAIDAPLTFDHYAGLEYQGEVALLSRSIQVVGEYSADDFGAHMKFAGNTAIARISGVHSEYMGQLNRLGRYPFHFHIMGGGSNAASSYFHDCSVTNAQFRAFVVHGTDNADVSRNVAFNVKGFAYYLEDGVEEDNLLAYNLAAFVHPIYQPANGAGGQAGEQFVEIPGQLLIPADTSASGFYVSNAYNSFVGNVASGGWSGFAFPNIPRRLGVFKDTLPADEEKLNPMNRPVKEFYGNSAHSTGFYWRAQGSAFYTGAWLSYDDETGLLHYDSGRHSRDVYDNSGNQVPMSFRNLKAYLTATGFAHWGSDADLDRAEFHDIYRAAFLFGSSALHNALINLYSANPENYVRAPDKVLGFQYYDTWVQVRIYLNSNFGYMIQA